MKFEEYLIIHEIDSVSIYGMGKIGLEIYDRLQKSDIVKNIFGIEKLNYAKKENYEIYNLYEDTIPEVDIVFVIPCREFEYIKWELYNFISDRCKIVRYDEFE